MILRDDFMKEAKEKQIYQHFAEHLYKKAYKTSDPSEIPVLCNLLKLAQNYIYKARNQAIEQGKAPMVYEKFVPLITGAYEVYCIYPGKVKNYLELFAKPSLDLAFSAIYINTLRIVTDKTDKIISKEECIHQLTVACFLNRKRYSRKYLHDEILFTNPAAWFTQAIEIEGRKSMAKIAVKEIIDDTLHTMEYCKQFQHFPPYFNIEEKGNEIISLMNSGIDIVECQLEQEKLIAFHSELEKYSYLLERYLEDNEEQYLSTFLKEKYNLSRTEVLKAKEVVKQGNQELYEKYKTKSEQIQSISYAKIAKFLNNAYNCISSHNYNPSVLDFCEELQLGDLDILGYLKTFDDSAVTTAIERYFKKNKYSFELYEKPTLLSEKIIIQNYELTEEDKQSIFSSVKNRGLLPCKGVYYGLATRLVAEKNETLALSLK